MSIASTTAAHESADADAARRLAQLSGAMADLRRRAACAIAAAFRAAARAHDGAAETVAATASAFRDALGALDAESEALRATKSPSAAQRAALGRAADEADALAKAIRAGRSDAETLEAFADFVAGDLDDALAALVEALELAARDAAGARKAVDEDARKVISDAVAEIENVSLSVRLIALNAAVEAARAGEAGKSFGVIASEIQSLSEGASASARRVRDQVARLT